MTILQRFRAVLLPLVAPLLLAVPALAVGQEAEESPQELFRWAMSSKDLGQVVLPQAGTGGWASGPHGVHYRKVPSYTGDPTFEVLIRAPYSGNPLLPERLLVQIPAGFYQQPFHERAVVVGFHSFSVSEKDIFINTTLPFEAAQRKWMLIAPYGLSDTNFANPQNQASFAAVAHILYSLIPFNYGRVYGVGFSMGGLNALSFGMRHLDRQQLQFAGLVVHTAPVDMVKVFETGSPAVQWRLSNAKHFAGTPISAPFEYERVSPVRLLPNGLVDPDHAPIVNFEGRPIYLHTNLADPLTDLVAGMSELRTFLQARGANIVEHLSYEPAIGHHWASLPLTAALDFVGAYSLPTAPSSKIEVFADAPGRWMHTEVASISPASHGHFTLEIAPTSLGTLNSFALEGTSDLQGLILKPGQLGLDPSNPVSFLHASADASADTIFLQGYPSPPTSVLVGGAPPAYLSHDPVRQELEIRPTTDGHAVQVDIIP